ncbi:MAG: hypothetical protein WA821_02760 [Anaerolineales bacterium]
MGYSVVLCLCGGGEHIFKQVIFERHAMRAPRVDNKELAITGEDAVFEADVMVAVIAVKGQVKLGKVKALSFACIPFCFFDFADDRILHLLSPFVGEGIEKGTHQDACLRGGLTLGSFRIYLHKIHLIQP